MRILVDTKNFALYGGGIAHWFAPLLSAWIEHWPNAHFLLVGPSFDTRFLPDCDNWRHVELGWPKWLLRPLQHPWYDNVLFPRAVSRLRPDLVLSPYHDVRLPKAIPSIIGVHDLCFDELKEVYPRRIRLYYLAMLRSNLRRASHVITVSQTSREKLVDRYCIPSQRVSVVYNASTPHFKQVVNPTVVADFKWRFANSRRFLFYSGGSEYRKNVDRLVQSFSQLAPRSTDLTLLVTGSVDQRWRGALADIPDLVRHRVVFSGKLSDADLRLAYAAAEAVVYPSLCEGFGRVCMEAMEAGAPLACSDLPVMHEVAGDYACYFDPYDVVSMTEGIAQALARGRTGAVYGSRFQEMVVKGSFLAALDEFMAGPSIKTDSRFEK